MIIGLCRADSRQEVVHCPASATHTQKLSVYSGKNPVCVFHSHSHIVPALSVQQLSISLPFPDICLSFSPYTHCEILCVSVSVCKSVFLKEELKHNLYLCRQTSELPDELLVVVCVGSVYVRKVHS